MNNRVFINLFKEALKRVPADYYGNQNWVEALLDTWGVLRSDPQRDPLKKYLSRYGEKVFCYELYHQTRMLMDAYLKQKPPSNNSTIIRLQAELQKKQVKDIIDHFPNIQPLNKEYIPDFLLHSGIAGDFQHQKLIIEVKSDPQITFSEIEYDLSKIQEFITKYHYRRGIFLTVNTTYDRIINILRTPANELWIQERLPNRRRILFMSKERQESPLYAFNLDQLPQEGA